MPQSEGSTHMYSIKSQRIRNKILKYLKAWASVQLGLFGQRTGSGKSRGNVFLRNHRYAYIAQSSLSRSLQYAFIDYGSKVL
jgi:hypothetical protein